ncbi:MAG: lysophospholipid acyltransferase family protein [Leptospiraceae bacterium]|nr:lysophospholipid acyltransferase family protein [Leptospiraceae bacterium]
MSKQAIQQALFPTITLGFLHTVGLLNRRIDLDAHYFHSLYDQKKPFILSIWHTNVLCSPYLNRQRNIAVLISASKDGDYINRVVHRLGNTSIRGSTSRRSVAALKGIIKHLRSGYPVAITPDGPRGPAFALQPGIIIAAQKAGVPIIPFHYECTRQWVAKSWDEHRIPKILGTFVCSYGAPIEIPAQLSADEFEARRQAVEKAMMANTHRARAYAQELVTGRRPSQAAQ